MRAITFTVEDAPGAIHGYREAERMIERGECITTTQMGLLNKAEARELYDVIRIMDGEDLTEIWVEKTGPHEFWYRCDKTERQLRYGHSLYRLWEAGEFLGDRPSAEDRLPPLNKAQDDVR